MMLHRHFEDRDDKSAELKQNETAPIEAEPDTDGIIAEGADIVDEPDKPKRGRKKTAATK